MLSGRADDFVCEVEKPVEAEPLTVPDPDAAVPEGIAEVLEDVVRRLARLAPRARVRARSKEGLLEYLYSRLRLNRARAYARGLLITFPGRLSGPATVNFPVKIYSC